jgi:uncharacterized OB-fold protein
MRISAARLPVGSPLPLPASREEFRMAELEAAAPRQLPGLDQDNRPYWTGGARGELLILRCRGCARYIHPPLPHCGECGTVDPLPVAVSGRGRIKSFTINHQPWVSGMAVPFVIAAIELDEQAGLYVLSNLVDCTIDEVHSGMAVAVRFEQHGEIFVPLFAPDAGR